MHLQCQAPQLNTSACDAALCGRLPAEQTLIRLIGSRNHTSLMQPTHHRECCGPDQCTLNLSGVFRTDVRNPVSLAIAAVSGIAVFTDRSFMCTKQQLEV